MTMVLQAFCIHSPMLGYFVVTDTKYDYGVTSILHTQPRVGLLPGDELHCCFLSAVP